MKTLRNILLLALMSAFVINLTSCSSDKDDEVKFGDMNMETGTEENIKNGDGLTWKSENDLIASVSGSVVSAVRQGSVVIASDKGSFKVNVTPKHTLYSDPCFEWGSSVSHVKSLMKGYRLLNETDKGLLYDGNGATKYVGYVFENAKLTSSGVFVKLAYMDDLVEHLYERYVYVGKDEDYNMAFISPDKKMFVGLTAQNLNGSYYYLILYFTSEVANSTTSKKLKGLKSVFGNGMRSNDNAKQEGCKHLMQKLMQKAGIK